MWGKLSKRKAKGSLVIVLVAVASTCVVGAQTDWPYLKLTPVIDEPTDTTHITQAGDGSGRLFAVGQFGRIRIIQSNQFLSLPFLEITNRVLAGGEQGLLSMAFPPGSGAKNHFYVNYTRIPDGATVISSFRVGDNPNQADPASEQVLLAIPQPTGIHNGGQIAFGPDGFLYVGMGDGGPAGSQDPAIFLGKLLRIDVESVTNGYVVPPGNPFVGNTNYLPEIWATGLRNPWRFSFDRLTGNLYIGDVGASTREEIDFQPAVSSGGQNYGWPIKEGNLGTNFPPGLDPSQLTAPIFEYGVFMQRKCVIGGFVYRGPSPRMDGIYVFGDYIIGDIHGLKQAGANWEHLVLAHGYSTVSFGEDEEGRLYMSGPGGAIYRIEDSGKPFPPTFDPLPQNALNVNFVTITTLTTNAVIHYTTDGSEPTETSPTLSPDGKVAVDAAITLKARAFRADLKPSDMTSAIYTNYVAAAPKFDPAGGAVTNGAPVAISTVTAGATIRYTLDGTDPGENSPIYTGPISFAGLRMTLQAKAFRDNYTPSATASTSFGLVIYEDAVVTTVAGDGTQGLRDGTGTNAQFYLPSAVRLDSQGNLIVGELMGGIRKISPQTKLRRYSVTT